MPLVSNIHHHVDPMRYPKVQEGDGAGHFLDTDKQYVNGLDEENG